MIYSIKITFTNGESIFIMATDRESIRVYKERFLDEPKMVEFKIRKEVKNE
ncbi:MAG: hypothetical protein GY853_00710 [PVC group bacterium]|nr:hypothetical protein [PVC group bacterium]